MRRRLQSYRNLKKPERSVLWQAWILLILVKLTVRTTAFISIPALLKRIPAAAPTDRVGDLDARRVSELVEIAGRRHWNGSSCLEKSVTVAAMLKRRGIGARLSIGLRMPGSGQPDFAHAWVEVENASGSGATLLKGHPSDGAFAPLLQVQV